MSDKRSPAKTKAARLALLLGLGCVACCALPLIGAATGIAALAGIAAYLEGILMAVLIGAALVALRLWVRRRSAPACNLDGPCAPPRRPTGNQP
ncbi:MAG: hypothetical protein IPO35_04920 [Uliginosibacterium sp.]|nr:hypothetical protein [Uliginosibacterium sp.]